MKCVNEGCFNEAPLKEKYNKKTGKTYSCQDAQCGTCYSLKSKYGINKPQRDLLLWKQNSKCKICGSHIEFIGTQGKHAKHSAMVDHDHATGNIRGILCNPCNLLLGFAFDSTNILIKAITYLQEAEDKPNEVSI